MQAMSDTAHIFKLFRLKRQTGEEGGGQSEVVSQSPPPNYDEGPHPLISGIQSLVIGNLSNNQSFFQIPYSLWSSSSTSPSHSFTCFTPSAGGPRWTNPCRTPRWICPWSQTCWTRWKPSQMARRRRRLSRRSKSISTCSFFLKERLFWVESTRKWITTRFIWLSQNPFAFV